MLALLLALGIAAPADTIAPRFALAVGESVRFTRTSETSQQFEAMGQKLKSSSADVTEYSLTCTARDEAGVATVALEVTRAHGSAEMPMMGKLTYDSNDGQDALDDLEGNPAAPMVLLKVGLVGQKVVLSVLPTGRISKVAGFADAMRKVLEGVESPIKTAVVGDDADEHAIAELQALIPELPEGELGLEGSWKYDYRGPKSDVGEVAVPMEARVTAADAEGFDFEASGTFAPAEDEAAAGARGGPRVTSLSRKGTGRIALKDGLPLRQQLEVTVAVEVPTPIGITPMLQTTKDVIERAATPTPATK